MNSSRDATTPAHKAPCMHDAGAGGQQLSARRDVSIDAIKVFAIFGVIMIHVCSDGFAQPVTSLGFLTTAFFGSAVRGSVPLFLMCSGALLLDPARDLSFKKLFTKQLPRLIVAMFFWAMLYKLYHLFVDQNLSPHTLWLGTKEVLAFNQEFHLYYIHMMLIVYLFLPITRLITAHASRQQLYYLLGLWLLFAIVMPTVQPYLPPMLSVGILGQFPINLCYASIGFGLLGYTLKTYPLSRVAGLLCAVAGLAIAFGGTMHASLQQGWFFGDFLNGNTLGVALLAAGLYAVLLSLPIKSEGKAAQVLSWLSQASFCMYLIHVFFLYLVQGAGFTVYVLPRFLSIPLMTGLIFLLCLPVYYILSKIPLVNRWLV